MSARPLRITFVLPFLSLTGGIRVMFEHTRMLRRFGHQVRLVAPRLRWGAPWTAAGRRALRSWWIDRYVERTARAVEYFGLADAIQLVPALEPEFYPDGDVVVATSWPTAASVAAAPARCGRGAYFIQHYEVFAPGLEDAVDATWRLPLERIVIATWLRRLARERFGVPAWGPIVNGVNIEQFTGSPRPRRGPLTVGMLYEIQPWKGLDDGFAAVEAARRDVPDLRLRLFGRYRLRHRLRSEDRYERNPPQTRLPEIYRECDAFLSPSHTEGCQLPPMEAMACGCAVVATEVGGIPDYAIPGTTVLTAAPREPARLAEHLVALARDEERRMDLARKGQEHIRAFTWERAARQLEEVFLSVQRGESAPLDPAAAGAAPVGSWSASQARNQTNSEPAT